MPGHRKPLPTASCIFTSDWWNDSEQRNYILYECKNPKNTGGNSNIPHGDFHGSRTYSCWYDNAGMKYIKKKAVGM